MKQILLVASLALSSFFGAPSILAQENTVAVPAQEVVAKAEVSGETIANSQVDKMQEPAKNTQESKLTREQKNERIQKEDPHGYVVTLMSMGIVILALIFLSALFVLFGKISQRMMQYKKKMEAQGLDKGTSTGKVTLDSGEVIAAISLALHEHFHAQHDIEETVLTMKKLKRAYSPWSSKIYNLREYPMRNVWRK